MKKLIILLIFIAFASITQAAVYNVTHDFQKSVTVEKKTNNITVKNIFYNIKKPSYPGNFSSFWFAFLISLPLGFTLYFAGVGFLTVLWVYLATKDKHESKLAIWGFLAGTVLGILIKLLYLSSI